MSVSEHAAAPGGGSGGSSAYNTTTVQEKNHSKDIASEFFEAIGFRADDRVAVCHRATEAGSIDWNHVTIADAPRVVAGHRHGDVWVSTCPLREGRIVGRGMVRDAAGIRALFADLDDEKMPDGRSGVEAVARDLAVALNRQPAAIVSTGHGLHLWFALDPAEPDGLDFEPDSQRSREVAALLKRFGGLVQRIAEARCGSADPVFDLARIMRVPGTVNTKKGHMEPVTVTFPRGGPLTLTEVAEACDAYNIAERPQRAATSPLEGEGVPVYAEMPAAFQSRVDAHVSAVLDRIGDELAAGAALDEGEQDEQGRGWQKILADAGHQGGALATDWSGLSHTDIRERLLRLVPETMKDATFEGGHDCTSTIDKHLFRKERATPPQWLASAIAVESDPFEAVTPTMVTEAETIKGRPNIARLMGAREWTDANFTDVFALVHADRLRYIGAKRQWLIYDEVRWVPTDEAAVIGLSMVFAQHFVEDVVEERNADLTKKAALRQSKGRIEAVVALAKGHDLLRVRTEDLDRDADLLNTPNGVVNLRTGELRPHDPDLMMTKVTGAHYVPGATHPDLDRVLDDLAPEIVDFLQISMGQAATGSEPDDDRANFLYGLGSNAKSTLLAAVMKALGDKGGYARFISERALMGDEKGDRHPTEIADFEGARLAVLEEFPKGQALSSGRLKKVTGVDVEARRMREDTFRWDSTHTLFVTVNERPLVRETDEGTWRRLRMIYFPIRYVRTKEEITGPNMRLGDPHLRARLRKARAQQEAVLAWVIEGARRHYAAGEKMPPDPPAIHAETEAWRETSDPVRRFLNENVEAATGWCIPSAELHERYREAMEQAGRNPYNDQKFVKAVAGHQLVTSGQVEKKSTRVSEGKHASRPRVAAHPTHRLVEHTYKEGQQVTAWVGLKWLSTADGEVDS